MFVPYVRLLMGCWVPRHKLPSINVMLGGTSLMGMSKEQMVKHLSAKQRKGG
jgi:hypothetical protein